jgi:hypothetical protein
MNLRARKSWLITCLTALTVALPIKSHALTQDQLTQLADLCARPHESFEHINASFVAAEWIPLTADKRREFIVKLALLKMLDNAPNGYILAALNSLGDPTAVDMELNPTDPDVIRWAIADRREFASAFAVLDDATALYYISPSLPQVTVRVTISGNEEARWKQKCDLISDDLGNALQSLDALFQETQIGDGLANGFRESRRFELPTHSLSPFAATPNATATIFDMPEIAAATGGGSVMPFWLNISLSIKPPSDLTPIEVTP